MNIALVTEHFDSGGLETHLQGFIRCLQASGHNISLITGTSARLEPLRGLIDGRILQLPIPNNPTGGLLLELSRRIAAFSLEERCELLHVHPFASLLLGGLAAVEARLPFVVTLHGPRNMSLETGDIALEILAQTVLSSATRIFCVSADLIPEVQTIQPLARCSPLPNGVDARNSRAVTRQPLGDWAIVTRLDRNKAMAARHAIEALGSLPGRSFRIRVFGDGPARGELEAWVADQSYASRVSFAGFCDPLRDSLEEGYAGAAAMARSLLDVGVLGLPVLLAGYDGIKGLVRPEALSALRSVNYTGRGFPSLPSAELAVQVADLDDHPEEYSLRAWILEQADESQVWKAYIKEVVDSYPQGPLDFEEWTPLIRTLRDHPGRAVFCEETLIPLVPRDRVRQLRVRIVKRRMRSLLRMVTGNAR
ncbi:MAG: glycosyltransferase [Acidobacteriota bacterium]